MTNLEVNIKGGGKEILTDKDFVGKGGGGAVYHKGGMAFKILNTMMPIGKIKELSVLNNKNIIKPENIILNKKNNPIGYTMRYINGAPIISLFTKAFKIKKNITTKTIINLSEKMYELVDHCHSKQILMVDVNELNFLNNSNYDEIYAIDVDSYQTPSFPATSIMETIRDRHCLNNAFTKETDWFSWGILTFQMLIGIHPYRGNHEDFDKYSLVDRLEHRMLKNVSVFNKKTRLPKSCESFDIIPTGLRHWYEQVFEKGKRLKPPHDFTLSSTTPIISRMINSNNTFTITREEIFSSEVLNVFVNFNNKIIVFKDHCEVNKIKHEIPSSNAFFVFTPQYSMPFCVFEESGKIKIFNLRKQKFVDVDFNADALMCYDNRIYVKNNQNVLEVLFKELNTENIHCHFKNVGNVLDLPSATKAYDGVILQNLLGKHHFAIFPVSGSCYQFNIPELDNHKIIDAKYENHVLVVSSYYNKYYTSIFKIDDKYQKCVLFNQNVVNYPMINFLVNDAGIGVIIPEEDKMQIFFNKIENTRLEEIKDNVIDTNMRLFHDGTIINFLRDNEIYRIKKN